jgi:hypothetical protein
LEKVGLHGLDERIITIRAKEGIEEERAFEAQGNIELSDREIIDPGETRTSERMDWLSKDPSD